MTYGFRAINAVSGAVQIDENYRNLELLYVAYFETQANPPANDDIRDVYYRSGFSHFATGYGSVFFQSPYWIAFRGRNGTRGNTYVVAAPAGTLIKAYIFGAPTEPVTGEYGLVVRDGAGQVMFNSNRYYARRVQVLTGANYLVAAPSAALPAGRQYAYRHAAWSGRSVIDDKGAIFVGSIIHRYHMEEWGLGLYLSGTTFASGEMYYLDTDNTGEYFVFNDLDYSHDWEERSYRVEIIDVTDFTAPPPP